MRTIPARKIEFIQMLNGICHVHQRPATPPWPLTEAYAGASG